MSALERHMKTAQVAEMTGVSPAKLRQAALRGEVDPVRIGTDLYWPESEVAKWLEQRRLSNSRGGTLVPLHTRASTTKRRSA